MRPNIAATDREIDQLVYELYGLTDKEIALVEEATARSTLPRAAPVGCHIADPSGLGDAAQNVMSAFAGERKEIEARFLGRRPTLP